MAGKNDEATKTEYENFTDEFFNEGLTDEEIEAARQEALEAESTGEVDEAGEAKAAEEAAKAESKIESKAHEQAEEEGEEDKAAAAEQAKERDAELEEWRAKNKEKSREDLEDLAFNQSKRASAEKHKGREKSAEAEAAAAAATKRAEDAETAYQKLIDRIEERRAASVKEAQDKAAARKEALPEDPDRVNQDLIDENAQRAISEAEAEAAAARRQASDAKLYELIPDWDRKAPVINETLQQVYGFTSDETKNWGFKEQQLSHDAHLGVAIMAAGYIDTLGRPQMDNLCELVDNYRAAQNGAANGAESGAVENSANAPSAEEKAAENQRKIEAAKNAQNADKSLSNLRGSGPAEPKKHLHERVQQAVDEMSDEEFAAFLKDKEGNKALREHQQ